MANNWQPDSLPIGPGRSLPPKVAPVAVYMPSKACVLNLTALMSVSRSPSQQVIIDRHHPSQGEDADREEQRQAMLYVVVVLLFYSMSIVVLMVKYIRRQRRQWEEEKALKQILERARQLTLLESKFISARHMTRWLAASAEERQPLCEKAERNKVTSV